MSDRELTRAQRDAVSEPDNPAAAMKKSREEGRVGRGRVFVVTRGHYSDYRVVAVFTDKMRAEALRERLQDESAEIEEWPLDVVVVRDGWYVYSFNMNRDGSVNFGNDEDPPDIDDERIEFDLWGADGLEAKIELRRYPQSPSFPQGNSLLACRIYAQSREHAVKIANERRAEMIAMNEWPPQPAPTGAASTSIELSGPTGSNYGP